MQVSFWLDSSCDFYESLSQNPISNPTSVLCLSDFEYWSHVIFKWTSLDLSVWLMNSHDRKKKRERERGRARICCWIVVRCMANKEGQVEKEKWKRKRQGIFGPPSCPAAQKGHLAAQRSHVTVQPDHRSIAEAGLSCQEPNDAVWCGELMHIYNSANWVWFIWKQLCRRLYC